MLLDPIAAQLGLVLAGLGALRAARVLEPFSLTHALKATGLAYLVGVALVTQLCVLLLVLGLPFGLPMVGVVCLALATPLLLDARRIQWRPRWRRPAGDELLTVVILGAFGVLAIVGLLKVANDPVWVYDAWNLWGRKAALMFYDAHLPAAVLGSTSGGYIHPDYPLVLPLLEAIHLRALHRYELSSVHTVIWALAIAFVWAGVYVGSRVARPSVCAVVFAGVVVLTTDELLTAYADVPMAFYLGLATLTLGIWLQRGRRSDLAVAAMLFAGASGIKNEGLMGTVVVIAAALIVLLAQRRADRARELTVAAIVLALVAIVPWHAWLAAHDLKSDTPFPGGLSPVFLADRVSRLGPAISGLYGALVKVASVVVLVPVALGLLLLRLRRSQRTPLVWFYLLSGVLYFAILVWAYWVNPLTVQFLVVTSASRICVGLALIALAAMLHLGSPASLPALPSPAAGDALDSGPVPAASAGG